MSQIAALFSFTQWFMTAVSTPQFCSDFHCFYSISLFSTLPQFFSKNI